MKRRLVLVALAIIGFSVLKAQSGIRISEKVAPIRMTCANVIPNANPLVLVDGFETDMQSIVLNPDNIESIRIEKTKKAMKKWGDKAKDGAILIQTRPGTSFYTVTDFINPDKNINASVRQVEVDGKLLPNMQKLLIDKTIFSGTMISSKLQVDEKGCNIVFDDTLVITTQQRKSGNN